MMHFTLIGRLDLAQQYGQALLNAKPEPLELLDLAEKGPYEDAYRILDQMGRTPELRDIAGRVSDLIEQGRKTLRQDPERIGLEIQRLSGTTRARQMAVERLKESGEWAIPQLINVLRDHQRSEEFFYVRWVLPQIGKPAVPALVTALDQSDDLNVRLSILEALGKIGYHAAIPYILEIIETESAVPELKAAALKALLSIQGTDTMKGGSAAAAFEDLAGGYYNHVPSLMPAANQEAANVWFWHASRGLDPNQVPAGAYDELMAMRCCEKSLRLDPHRPGAISLWLSAFFRLQAEGFAQPGYFGAHHADASTYALTAGPEYLHRVLRRALLNRNRPVALAAITTLRRNSGQQSLLYELDQDQPLVKSLTYPDREVRFNAALTIGGVLARHQFTHSENVLPILSEALRQKGKRFAVVVSADGNKQLAADLKAAGSFDEVVAAETYGVGVERAAHLASIDLLVLDYDIRQPDIRPALQLRQNEYRLAFCPTVIVVDAARLERAKPLQDEFDFVAVLPRSTPAGEIVQAAQKILAANQVSGFDPGLADIYATAAADVLRRLAHRQNPVFDLKRIEPTLIEAVNETRPQIQQMVTETLAQLDSLDAQRAIARLALDDQTDLPIRLMALGNLAVSAKQFGNLLLGDQVRSLYLLVGDLSADSQLRNMAAEAYGSLNLPSAQISQLILDQVSQ
ncbi:MAG: HEAT repeat domain-containing protein [Sedimentisphaerales bacterium]|nr:HEAT repeat domain-containing protein [Sedimentisphaerales bacterium]